MAKTYDINGNEEPDGVVTVRLNDNLSIDMGDDFIIFNNEGDEEYPDFVLKTKNTKETLENLAKGIGVLLKIVDCKDEVSAIFKK